MMLYSAVSVVITDQLETVGNQQQAVIKTFLYEITETASEGNVYTQVGNIKKWKITCN